MSEMNLEAERASANAFVDQFTAMPVGHIMFNSAVTRTTATEIQAALSFGQRPLSLLILSPAMAKTFAADLLARVSEYEVLTGSPVYTVTEVAQRSGQR